jgi:lon-related putative ATP-dependent protease
MARARTRKTSKRSAFELKSDSLRWECNANRLGFETTADLRFKPDIIGQERALDAMRLGLTIRSPGYNIFISGLMGTGKLTAIRHMLDAMDLRREDLVDICYVHNFDNADEPVCLMPPMGQACKLRKLIHELRKTITEFIPAVLQSEQFKLKQAAIADEVQRRRDDLLARLETEVTHKGFSMVEVQHDGFERPEIAPMVAGEAIPVDRLPSMLAQGKIGQGDYDKLKRAYPELSRKLDDFLLSARVLAKELDGRTAKLERSFIEPFVDHALEEIKHTMKDEKVVRFVTDLREYILGNLPIFVTVKSDDKRPSREFLPFEVNVLVDNTGLKEAPVVIETSPTYVNVFGTIERYVGSDGEQTADHTAIRGGSLLRANGGYLIMNLIDVFEEPMVWPALKRSLKSQRHTIRGFDSLLLMPIASIKPEPMVLDLKIVLIGDAWSYQMLWEYDEDFRSIFKVKADFDSEMPATLANQKKYGRFVRVLTQLEDLPKFHKSAVAAIIEYGVRLAGRRDRLSTRFSEIGDVLREAVHWSEKMGATVVKREHVERALEERRERVSLIETKMQEMYDDGRILMDTRGAEVGQVNGLAVYDFGDHVFGRPSRITAETGVGRSGIINIEREAELSGRIHNKGVLILEGYLRRMYAQDKPITVTASLCFEQGYSGVDGDSASSAEMYALLSSIAIVPLRQDLAVTGSMNQKGEIQPIGGVNEKIEGFFDVCKGRGFTGRQGVVIPALNVPDLMLRADVVDAVKRGKFHIYAIRSIDEGIEILTRRKAGRLLRSGRFESRSFHDTVDRALRRLHEELRNAEDGHGDSVKVEPSPHAAKNKKPRPPRPPKTPREEAAARRSRRRGSPRAVR